jgi:hypothetical protein
MGYYNKLSLETRTFGEAAEDARLDRRDGFGSTRRNYQPFTPVHRSAAWWREYNAEQKERGRASTLGMWKRGLTSGGSRMTVGYFYDLERAGFVVVEDM